jgi:hypothetical protein
MQKMKKEIIQEDKVVVVGKTLIEWVVKWKVHFLKTIIKEIHSKTCREDQTKVLEINSKISPQVQVKVKILK